MTRFLALAFLSTAAWARADVTLPAIFGDHMVLQEGASLPVWGKAAPGEAVTATIGKSSGHATADAQGKWRIDLPPLPPSSMPTILTVTGKSTVIFHDVVVGQAWLASGQSNMALTLRETHDAPAEIARSTDPLLRQFKVKPTGHGTPADDCSGRWVLAGPETSGDFSSAAYYFGKRLRHDLRQPVGLINASQGGTVIEAWTSAEAIASVPSLKAEADARHARNTSYPQQRAAFTMAFEQWAKSTGREDRRTPDPTVYTGDTIHPAEWTTLTLPTAGSLTGPNLPANGVLWLRKEVDIPPSLEKLPVKIGCGRISGFTTAYWNGNKVDESTPRNYPGAGHVTYFGVTPEQTHAGRNILALRIYAPDVPFSLTVAPQSFTAGPVNMSGPWQARAEFSLPPLDATALAQVPHGPKVIPGMDASVLFNGFIHPLIPYALAGVIWYQGESNAGNSYEYRTEFPLLINDWRAQWNQPALPFYFCQLANSLPKIAYPGSSMWAELREAQSTALRLPATGQAVLIDLGDSDDLHYRDKKEVGERLARIALARSYGRKLAWSGPVYDSMTVEGNKIRIKFAHAESGLKARPLPATYSVRSLTEQTAPLVPNSPGSQLEGFAICGKDRRFIWAQARIDGESVVVWSDKILEPVAVRYGWAENPTCNLYNAAGLPASPFRTDDFPATTAKSHF